MVCTAWYRLHPLLHSSDHSLSISFLALTNSVATVCNPTDVNCLDDSFPPLGNTPRGQVNHVPVVTEELLTLPSNGESDCFNLFETGFYHSELNPMCSEESERPAKRLKMGIAVPESFMNEVSVNNLGVDFENHTHHITSAKMTVSVDDFGSLSASETNGFINAMLCISTLPFIRSGMNVKPRDNGCAVPVNVRGAIRFA